MGPDDAATAVQTARSPGISIARLTPVGPHAEKVFSRIVDSKGLSQHHREYIHANSRSPCPESPISSADTDLDSESEESIWAGHYLLSTDRPGFVKPMIGWRLGRGTSRLKDRGVDLLVTCPGQKSHDVAVVHALIQIHPDSGVLMLRGVSDKHPVRYSVGEKVMLFANESHVLSEPHNQFSLGKLQFELDYEQLNEEQYVDYLEIRNRALQEAGREAPDPRIVGIPRKSHRKAGDLILHGDIKTGAFGFVRAAVESRTGRPVAIKEVWIKERWMIKDKSLLTECDVLENFKDAEGLLQAYHVRCQHDHSRPCGAVPELFWMTFPLALHDFTKQQWSKTPLPTLISLIRGPLLGLKAMHEVGYIHRDVTAKNLLVLGLDPPKAVLCDYGKATRALHHNDSRIGPVSTMAPEVDGQTQYDNKIDIWGIGHVCICILFPDFQRPYARQNERVDRGWYSGVMDQLSKYEGDGPSLKRDFADLVRKMLCWWPQGRPSAAQALRHRCIRVESAPPISTPEGRKLKMPKTATRTAHVPGTPNSPNQAGEPPMIEAHSGDTELLTPGREPTSFG